ncbi:hypothetical protein TWF694_003981 [Orbilia ellipsospora]|uniref:Uncharacterized protein n=1 Tax=Orbilia ellipsospora TaxID=2528407 RepID=A0AAV9WWR1_9PEZI
MPITWTHENVSRLFLVTLAVHHIHMDYKQIAAAFGGDASPRAIEEKMKKLRKEAREFGDGSIDMLIARGRKDTAGGKSGTSGKGSKGAGKNGKGRARPVKYENGKIKWEYDNCEDDSEGESDLSPRGYGDLMECYLMKKENKAEEENGVSAAAPEVERTPLPYYMVDPMFTTGGYAHSGEMVGEIPQQLQIGAGDIEAVVDPMLTNGVSNITFQPEYICDSNILQGSNEVSSLAWEQNQDLRDLNNEFRPIDSSQLMDIDVNLQIQVEIENAQGVQRGNEESISNGADVGDRVVNDEMDIIDNDTEASS